MKLLITFFLFVSISVQAQDTTKVLFIGNSITYYNDMPQTFEAIANSKFDTTQVTVYAPGGTGFIDHVSDQNVYTHFRTGNWDYVVLQPGSNESPGYTEPIASTLGRARQLKDSILKYSPCAKIVFYEITYGVWGNDSEQLVEYNETMDLIKANLTQLADSTQQCFAPAGEAIKTAWNDNQNTMFWGGTGNIHPNVKGSYIIACSFYASIFEKPSFGTSVLGGLTVQEANQYQTLADTTVLNYKPEWRIGTFDLVSDFNFTTNEVNIVNFFDNSQYADSIFWDFGDGASSKLINPIHTYNSINSYDVTHTAYKNGCAKDSVKTVLIEMLNANVSKEKFDVTIFPNPSTNFFTIKLPYSINQYYITVFDELGKTVLFEKSTTQSFKIDLLNNPKGLYFVKIETEELSVFKKIVRN